MNKLSMAALITAVLALCISVGSFMFFIEHQNAKQPGFGAVSNANCVSGTVTCYSDTLVQNLWITAVSYLAGNSTTPPTPATSLGSAAVVGSCNTASSSAAVIANPFAATSTASVEMMVLGFNATSTTLTIGTTTLASGLTSTNPGTTGLAVAALQATGTQATIVSGGTTSLGSGQISSGSGSVSKIVVGPNENIGIFSTSTYGNAGALNYTPSSCTYKILWRN